MLLADTNNLKFFKNQFKFVWEKENVDVVDATGKFKDIEGTSLHLKAGAKKVIITVPSKDSTTIVLDVNDDMSKKRYANCQ